MWTEKQSKTWFLDAVDSWCRTFYLQICFVKKLYHIYGMIVHKIQVHISSEVAKDARTVVRSSIGFKCLGSLMTLVLQCRTDTFEFFVFFSPTVTAILDSWSRPAIDASASGSWPGSAGYCDALGYLRIDSNSPCASALIRHQIASRTREIWKALPSFPITSQSTARFRTHFIYTVVRGLASSLFLVF